MSSQIVRPQGYSANIFINYRREDSSGHAGRLFDALSGHFARRLFMDIDTLEPGVDFADAIEQAVGSCEVLIVVIGREWLTVKNAAGQRRLDDSADFVRLEVETALERKIRVIPVLVQDAPMPRADELPPSLARLARRNAIELSDARWAYDVDRLARTIQGILEEAPPAPFIPEVAAEAVIPPAPFVPAFPAKAAGSPVWRLSLAALVLVASAGLACALWMPRTPRGDTANSLKPEAPQTPLSAQTPTQTPIRQQAPVPQRTTIQQPVVRPPAPLSTPPASTPAVLEPPVPSPAPSPPERKVVIPVQLAGEGRARREKEEPMKKGDLIMDGPGVEEMQLIAAPFTPPPSLAGNVQHAKIVLQVLVDENGEVGDSRVESLSVDDGSADADLRELRKAALEAAHQARFEPATKDGIAGKMWGELSYEFGTKK